MLVQLTPELEQRLQHVAHETQRSTEELTISAVQALVEDFEEQLAAVKESDEQFERGEFFSQDEVLKHLRKRFAKA